MCRIQRIPWVFPWYCSNIGRNNGCHPDGSSLADGPTFCVLAHAKPILLFWKNAPAWRGWRRNLDKFSRTCVLSVSSLPSLPITLPDAVLQCCDPSRRAGACCRATKIASARREHRNTSVARLDTSDEAVATALRANAAGLPLPFGQMSVGRGTATLCIVLLRDGGKP
jgi:hypothetical protein